jgi:hypothetical protein
VKYQVLCHVGLHGRTSELQLLVTTVVQLESSSKRIKDHACYSKWLLNTTLLPHKQCHNSKICSKVTYGIYLLAMMWKVENETLLHKEHSTNGNSRKMHVICVHLSMHWFHQSHHTYERWVPPFQINCHSFFPKWANLRSETHLDTCVSKFDQSCIS